MNIVAWLIFGAIVVIIAIVATLFFVLSEAKDPESTKENSLSNLERSLVQKKREDYKHWLKKHDKKSSSKKNNNDS